MTNFISTTKLWNVIYDIDLQKIQSISSRSTKGVQA